MNRKYTCITWLSTKHVVVSILSILSMMKKKQPQTVHPLTSLMNPSFSGTICLLRSPVAVTVYVHNSFSPLRIDILVTEALTLYIVEWKMQHQTHYQYNKATLYILSTIILKALILPMHFQNMLSFNRWHNISISITNSLW